jgi:hypothetical protein
MPIALTLRITLLIALPLPLVAALNKQTSTRIAVSLSVLGAIVLVLAVIANR